MTIVKISSSLRDTAKAEMRLYFTKRYATYNKGATADEKCLQETVDLWFDQLLKELCVVHDSFVVPDFHKVGNTDMQNVLLAEHVTNRSKIQQERIKMFGISPKTAETILHGLHFV